MSLPMDATPALISSLTQRMEAIRAANYRGRDGERLVEAIVDGDGVVVEIAFTQTIAQNDPERVAAAIRAAVDAAQQSLVAALAQLAQEVEDWQTTT